MIFNAQLNKKLKTKFKRNKNQIEAKLVNKCGYYPPCNVKISKTLTKNLEKQQVTQHRISNPLKYLVKVLAMQRNDGQIILDESEKGMSQVSSVINIDLKDKNSHELFCVAKKNRYNKLEVCDELFTREKLINEQLAVFSLPESSRNKLQCKNGIVLKNINKLVQYCKWKDVRVYNKQKYYNTQRITLSITKERLNPIIKQRLDNISNNNNKNNNELIPIVMFDNNSHWMEYIFIVQIDDNINIGISLRQMQNKRLRITGIHLDKQMIVEQHELAVRHNCHCLDRFVSKIHDIQIGNPNVLVDQVKSYKHRYETLKKFVERFRHEQLPEKITALQKQSDLFLQNDNGQLHVSENLFSANLLPMSPISLQSSSSMSHSTSSISPSPSMISTSSNDTHPSGYYSQSSQQSVCMDLNELDLSQTSNYKNTIEENKMDEDNDVIM